MFIGISTSRLGHFDVDVDLRTSNWYVPLWSAAKTYYADLGAITAAGEFIPLVRSNSNGTRVGCAPRTPGIAPLAVAALRCSMPAADARRFAARGWTGGPHAAARAAATWLRPAATSATGRHGFLVRPGAAGAARTRPAATTGVRTNDDFRPAGFTGIGSRTRVLRAPHTPAPARLARVGGRLHRGQIGTNRDQRVLRARGLCDWGAEGNARRFDYSICFVCFNR